MTNEPAPARPITAIRPEIQALRAIAVLAVVIYHFWPNWAPGGYVGVDTFFVISGFLITSQLLREIDSRGRVRLPEFWARRARRLLPAALLVLLATTIFVYIFVPLSQWTELFRQIIASALYVENWTLASDSVNYLSSDAAPSLTQHYWSLSVEEQFYLLWPLLLLLAVVIARRRTARRIVIAGTVGVVTLASFVYCVLTTTTDPSLAYFATTTRAWEFGLGGLLAVAGVTRGGRITRTIVSWLGLALLAFAILRFTGATPFPGWEAAIPALGAAAVLWAGSPAALMAPSRLYALRPVQFLGDVSYSFYLWHWPLIIGATMVVGAAPGLALKVGLLAGALLLAWATKRFVEDPIRARSSILGRNRPSTTYAAMLAAMALVVVTSTGGLATIHHRVETATALVARAKVTPGVCLGAAAMDPSMHCDNSSLGGTITPDTSALTQDIGSGFDCDASRGDPIQVCHFGSTSPTAVHVALTGDSHAAMMLPVIEKQLGKLNWSLDTYLGGGCVWGDFEGNPICDNRKPLQSTFDSSKYSIILEITTRWAHGPLYLLNPSIRPAGRPDSRIPGFEAAWAPVLKRGGKVVVLADNPSFPQSAIDCLNRSHTVADAKLCTVPRSVGLDVSDAAARAARATPGVSLIDLTNMYCTKTSCPLVIGNVAAYYNTTHITETYAQTLGPYLEKELESINSN